MTEPLIHAEGLIKRFGRKSVLEGVSLDVPRGSVLGLLGRNGAGKTTLLRCLLGLIRADGGDARVLGHDPWSLPSSAKARLGYVPQEVELYPWMKVGEILDHIGSFYPLWNDHFVRETAHSWELDLEDDVRTLSRGNLQKLGILLALGHEPDLVVLDEPAASLDPAARRDFLAKLVELVADLGQTVLFSTHITSDLERVADRVAILREGTIAWAGELDELKEQVKRIRLVGRLSLPRSLEVPEALYTRINGKEAQLSVSHCDAALLARLERDFEARAEVQDLNLEDIFLEMHHGRRP